MVDLTAKRCEVCGGEESEVLCRKCGSFVCHDCWDEESSQCVNCVEEGIRSKAANRRRTQFAGIALILLGLSAMAAGLVSSIQAPTVTLVLPFLVGDVAPAVAGGYSFLFFTVVIGASLLPWYLHISRVDEYPSYQSEGDGITLQEGKMQGGESTVDYVITTEVPRSLEKTIIVETNPDSITLKSSADKAFSKQYSIPVGFDLEGLDYDYDEGYLVLNLHLVRVG